jgi:hypothetical protein
MCGFFLQVEVKKDNEWRWFKQIHYSSKKVGEFERALHDAVEALREMKASYGGSWGSYRLMESSCRGDAWQIDFHSGETIKDDFNDPHLFLGRPFYASDWEAEEDKRRQFEEMMKIVQGSSGALSRRRKADKVV